MGTNRRDFLRAGVSAGVTAGTFAATPHWLRALASPMSGPAPEAPPVTDPSVRELALRAVEAARAAGATYADVRFTHTRVLHCPGSGEQAWLDAGVRALVDGYWGFAASTVWTRDELVRLGREATDQAKANARLRTPRVVELSRVPVVPDSHWTTPVARDPFDVPDGEIEDYLASLAIYAARKTRGSLGQMTLTFQRQDKAFASSEGSYCTQRLYQAAGTFVVARQVDGNMYFLRSPIIAGASGGWEYITHAPLREEIHRLIAEMEADAALPKKPVEVGRYDTVFDAQSMATLLDGTLGTATELDRALGYEANAGGTSYLHDPVGMRGRYQTGAPHLTVTGDRTTPGGLATVRWDDDGVVPEPFTLVKDGVVVDFQTHREGAGWLQASRSHGCAAAPRAFEAPLIYPPNLTLAPGPDALDFDRLVGGLKKGLAVKQLTLHMDFQCLNGFGQGRVYEIQNGRRVARIQGAGFLVRAPEFWRGLQALGDAASQRPFALRREKGEPAQATWHTVTAGPGVAQQVTTIEAGRRA